MSAKARSAATSTIAPMISGAMAAAILGLFSGVVLKPTPAESGLPRPPQLMHLTDAELALMERSPALTWPSVPRA